MQRIRREVCCRVTGTARSVPMRSPGRAPGWQDKALKQGLLRVRGEWLTGRLSLHSGELALGLPQLTAAMSLAAWDAMGTCCGGGAATPFPGL